MEISIKNLKQGFKAAAKNLAINTDKVDKLNVFPVPDGDTGTNMTMTINTALSQANEVESNDIKDVINAFSKGALLGARGNSGVIVSQIIGGFFTHIADNIDAINNKVICEAFEKSTERAYKAVLEPVEGTILTVSKDMAISARDNLTKDLDLVDYLETIYKDAIISLDNTPNILPVLKEAGVVDAGGMGLVIILEGFIKWLKNDSVFEDDEDSSVDEGHAKKKSEGIKYGYCTEFLLGVDSNKLERIESQLKSELNTYGDSLLVVGMDDTIKVHLHTEHPGKVLETALKHGYLSNIDIDNMRIQSGQMQNISELKPIGVITVSVGEGFNEIFKSLNVDKIIEGGQTMNPSTQEFLEAVEEMNAEDIYIFPNNSNIIMAVEQVVGLTDKNVHVIPTKSIPEGILAILNLDEDDSAEENIENAKESLKEIKTAEITFAVRDTSIDGKPIKKDDVLGIYNKSIVSNGVSAEEVALTTIEEILESDDSFISIYYGEDTDEDKALDLKHKLKKLYTHIDIQLIKGGQPLYYYIISVE